MEAFLHSSCLPCYAGVRPKLPKEAAPWYCLGLRLGVRLGLGFRVGGFLSWNGVLESNSWRKANTIVGAIPLEDNWQNFRSRIKWNSLSLFRNGHFESLDQPFEAFHFSEIEKNAEISCSNWHSNSVTHSAPVSSDVSCPRQNGSTCNVLSMLYLLPLHRDFRWFAVFLKHLCV